MMKRNKHSAPPEDRAWEALDAVKDYPQVQRWLAESDTLVESRSASRGQRWRWAVAASVAALALAAGGYWHWSPVHYQTGLGEQRDVTLPDGSRVTLNTDTSIAVRYSSDRRYIKLRQGEALFAVKADAARPFEVLAGGALTRALGTEFNVDLRASKVTVSVLEGAVRVVPVDGATPEVAEGPQSQSSGGEGTMLPMAALAKGQALEFRSKDGRMQERKADLRRIDAWRTRRLEFTDTPLSQAVEEFNRYSSVRVVVGTPNLATVRVSGVFRIGDTDGFLYTLREALRLETHESDGEVVVMRSRD